MPKGAEFGQTQPLRAHIPAKSIIEPVNFHMRESWSWCSGTRLGTRGCGVVVDRTYIYTSWQRHLLFFSLFLKVEPLSSTTLSLSLSTHLVILLSRKKKVFYDIQQWSSPLPPSSSPPSPLLRLLKTPPPPLRLHSRQALVSLDVSLKQERLLGAACESCCQCHRRHIKFAHQYNIIKCCHKRSWFSLL